MVGGDGNEKCLKGTLSDVYLIFFFNFNTTNCGLLTTSGRAARTESSGTWSGRNVLFFRGSARSTGFSR